MKSLLIIKLGALGDFIRSLGAMKSIRVQFPEAHITLLTGRGLVSFAKQSGYFDEIIVDTRSNWNLAEWYRICKKTLSDRPYDLVFDLQASRRTSVKYFTAVRFLTKYPLKWRIMREKMLCRDVEASARFRPGHLTEYTEPVPFAFEKTDLSFCKGEQRYFDLLPQRYILLIPGCSPKHPYKRWPAESFGEVAKRFAKEGISSVVLGTQDEAENIQIITRMEPSAVNFMNKASLLDIPALASRALACLGNDTGPSHIAAFCSCPLFVLFCEKTKKAMCAFAGKQTFLRRNIDDIPVEDVWQSMRQTLGLPEV